MPVDNGTPLNALHTAFRFMRTVRMRKGVMILCLFLSCSLGALYFTTATRMYESKADLLVLQLGPGVMDDNQHAGSPTRHMPTFQKVMTSDEVVERTCERLPEQHRVDMQNVTRSRWAAVIQSGLSVRSARQTNVLELTYRSRSPETAAVVLMLLLDSYSEFLDETHKGNAEQNLEKLHEVHREIEVRLEDCILEQLQLKQQSRNFIDTGGESSFVVAAKQTQLLQLHLVEAQNETVDARTQYEAIYESLQSGGDILQHLVQSADFAGRSIVEQHFGLGTHNSLQVIQLNQAILDERAELRNKLRTLDDRHPTILRLRSSIQDKESYLRKLPAVRAAELRQLTRTQLAPQLLRMAWERLKTAERKEQTLQAGFAEVMQRALSLNAETSRLKILEGEISYLQKYRAQLIDRITGIDLEKDTFLRTKVTTPPRVNHRPVSPKLAIVCLLSIMMGLSMGFGTVYVLDVLDDRFRSPEELRLQLGTSVLAMVPKMDDLEGEAFESIHTFARPNGAEAEAFRTLRTAIEFSSGESQRIVSTSTEPGDGKTTVTVNLAIAFAQSGRKTLLIDADMRRPGLSTLLGMRDSIGLSQVLRAATVVEEDTKAQIRSTPIERLDLLTCGPRPTNPSGLLASERFAELLAWAETQYDQILIDAPPVLAVSDPAIIGRLVDGVVMIIRPDKDRRRMVIRATESLMSLGCNICGVVVNHLTSDHGGDYSYGYGYGYGYAYGSDDDDDGDGDGDDESSSDPHSTHADRAA